MPPPPRWSSPPLVSCTSSPCCCSSRVQPLERCPPSISWTSQFSKYSSVSKYFTQLWITFECDQSLAFCQSQHVPGCSRLCHQGISGRAACTCRHFQVMWVFIKWECPQMCIRRKLSLFISCFDQLFDNSKELQKTAFSLVRSRLALIARSRNLASFLQDQLVVDCPLQ